MAGIGEHQKGRGSGTYAARTKNGQILSLDFELKGECNVSYPNIVGKLLMDKIGNTSKEIEGVHRSGIQGRKGFMKIKMKQKIDVNKRFGKSGGKAEDEHAIVTIRGVKVDDGSVVIRIISPNETISMDGLKRGISTICEIKSEIYDEKYAASVQLFGGLPNGNFRIRGTFKSAKEEELNEILVESCKVKIAILGKRR